MLDANKICDIDRLYFHLCYVGCNLTMRYNRLCFYLHYGRYNGIIKLMGYDFHFGIRMKCDYACNITSVDVSYLAW